MKHRVNNVAHEFLTYIPEELDDGVLYISIQHRVAMHRCFCGCGDRVVTPLDPAQWALTHDGETVSLHPSIGGGPCNSHYFITRGTVRWALPLTEEEKGSAAARDQAAMAARHRSMQEIAEAPTATATAERWWTRAWRRLRGRA